MRGTIFLLFVSLLFFYSCDGSPASGTTRPVDPRTGKPLESVELKWYFYGPEQPDGPAVYAAVNALLKKKLNTTVSFQPVEPKDYTEKMANLLASGEEFDACFTAGWVNDYRINAASGSFLPLDELLLSYCPTLLSTVAKPYWDATKVNGKLYGFLNYQIMCKQSGIWFNKDLVERLGLSDKVANLRTMEDLETLFQKVRVGAPDCEFLIDAVPDLPVRGQRLRYLDKVVCLSFDFDDPFQKGVFDLDHPQNVDRLKTARRWSQKGFLLEKQAYIEDYSPYLAQKKLFSGIIPTLRPGLASELGQEYGFEVLVVPTGLPYIDGIAATSTMHSISRTSKHPERVAMVMEEFYRNPELTNLMAYGLEGKHYRLSPQGKIMVLPSARYSGYAWMWGNSFQARLLEGQPDDLSEQTLAMNANALASPLLGFSFDPTPVLGELALQGDVYAQYRPALSYGLEDTERLRRTVKVQYERAGLAKVRAEIQKQVDRWMASQP